ncbi:hypothetical protein [Gulosibacter faecalis]|uniref:DUF732 domain-containing protein n=1 Tax=Gulosibacter faecalis TaxID=272240 RepID=A0ABW5UWZ0_9MICO|nr:hypothetical protein [Gulosibacter faecalis]
MKLRRLAVVPMIGAALALTACSGAAEPDARPDAGGPAELPILDEFIERLTAPWRPTADELKNAISEQVGDSVPGLDDSQQDDFFTCVAQGMVDSDISDETLNKVLNDEQGTSEEQSEVTEVVTEISTDCATDILGG